jgi:hypothetical protein
VIRGGAFIAGSETSPVALERSFGTTLRVVSSTPTVRLGECIIYCFVFAQVSWYQV